MERIRVLFVSHTEVMAGANSSLLRLVMELRENYGVEPTVLMPRIHKTYEKRNLYKACQEHHIQCFSYRFYWFKNSQRLVSYLRCLANLFCYPRILFKLRGEKFDIIHSNGSVFSLGALIGWVKGTPHVWHLREFGDLDFGLYSLPGCRYERWLYHYGDVFIAISDVIKKHFSARISPDKIKTIYNGVAMPDGEMVAEHNNDIVQFCMVGLVSKVKNQKEALKAVDLLVNKYDIKNFHLSFIGVEIHPYVEELYLYVETHGLGDYIAFMGERGDVDQLLKEMDVGLMLSNNEAFGRVTVEYMLHSLAVVASDTGANQEIVVDGVSGYVYPLGQTECLAQRMKELISNPIQLRDMAMKGRQRALELFTSERNTKEVYQVYQSLKEKVISSN